jgi:hypothetical protein
LFTESGEVSWVWPPAWLMTFDGSYLGSEPVAVPGDVAVLAGAEALAGAADDGAAEVAGVAGAAGFPPLELQAPAPAASAIAKIAHIQLLRIGPTARLISGPPW